MAIKLSVFTTATRPFERGDIYDEASNCYQQLADEVVVVDGGRYGNVGIKGQKHFLNEWPKEFDWTFIGQQFQRGYEACTGDWILHCDLDFIFHENDFQAIRQACEDNNDQPAFSMLKRQFVLPDRFNLKSRLVVAVNKGKFGDRIRFNSGGDLCQPSLDGNYIEPGTVPDVKIPIWNYDFLTKTKEQITDDVSRMDRAWQRHFGNWLYSNDGSEESAYFGWLKMVTGRLAKPHELIALKMHPKYVIETISNLESNQAGYSLFGNAEPASYYKDGINA